MPRYLVQWEIDVDEPDPIAAARAAWGHMRTPESIANVFDVVDEFGNITRVDLQEWAEKAANLSGDASDTDVAAVKP